MLPPNNMALRRLSRQEGISEATLHKWRQAARGKGRLLPDADTGPEGWSSCDKFAAAVETAAMNAADLAEYCRQRGGFAEQISAWRTACKQADDRDDASAARLSRATRDEKKRNKLLARELARKEQALAEAAALLSRRKKAAIIRGRDLGDDMRSGAAGSGRPVDGPKQGTPRACARGSRGRMISSPDRQTAVTLIDAATIAGARQFLACRTLKLSPRSYRRWTVAGDVRADQRPLADRPEPHGQADGTGTSGCSRRL